MSNNKVYNDLIDLLRNWIFGLPESKYLLPLFELRFTPEEAEFLSKIPFLPHTAEDLSDKLETPVVELTKKLDDLAQKGMIFRVEGRSAIRYSLPDSLFLFYRSIGWAGLDDEFNREISPLLNQYYIEAYAKDYLGHPTQGLRTIPINETIQDTRKVMPYEDILKVIDHVEYYTVSTCPCSHRHNTDPDIENCKYDTLKCLHFDRLGRYIVQNGLGKEITKEETLEILKKAANAGLVHGISTTKERIDTICNCCTCCCLFLESAVKMPGIIPRGHQPSNYIREIDEEKCVACGICVTFCPMKALELNDKKVIFDPERCLGCGVCVHKCPQEACYLIHRDEEQDFPKDPREQSSRFLRERGHDPLEIFKKKLLVKKNQKVRIFMGKWTELDKKLNKFLRLATFPIAVKLLKDKEELKAIKFLKKSEKKIALCQIFSYSRYYGWTIGCTMEDNLYPLANIALGFEEPYKLFLEGAFFVGRYNETKEAAKKTTATMPKIPYGKFSAIVSRALNRVEFEPDFIMIWGNSAQIMRIIQGSLWKEGGRITMSTFCDGVCADTIAKAYLTEELQIAFPCLGDRRFGMAKDTDLIASIPFGVVDSIIEGMEKTHKAGTRYPIPYELSTPEFFVKLKKQLDKVKKD